jgi:hypothetical protein
MMSIVDRLHTLVDAQSPEAALVSGVGQMTAAVASAAGGGTNPPAVPPPTLSTLATSATSSTPQGSLLPQPPQPPQPQGQHVQQVLIAGLGPPMAPNTAPVALRNQAGQLHALVAQTAAAVHQATTHGPQPPQTWQAQYYARAANVLASAAQDLMQAATASAQVLFSLSFFVGCTTHFMYSLPEWLRKWRSWRSCGSLPTSNTCTCRRCTRR